jgi:hypothetical protein
MVYHNILCVIFIKNISHLDVVLAFGGDGNLILPQHLTCKLSKPLAYITYPTLVQVVAT